MKKRLIIGIGALLIVGISFVAFLTFYHKQKKSIASSVQDRVKYDSAIKALAVDKKYLRSLAISLGVNYFSRHSDSSQIDISFFMFERMSNLANKRGVQLVGFSPATKEVKRNYTKISFVGEIDATYPEMVHFFQDLEDREKLLVNNLEVTTTSLAPQKRRAKFELSCLEFTDQLFENLQKAEQVSHPSSSPGKTKAETMARDPFLNSFEVADVSPSKEVKPGADLVDLSAELSLTGIITFPLPETAIIEHTMLKKGDKINNKEIVDIKKDRVTLKEGEQLYILKLKEVATPTNTEVNPLEHY